MEKIGKKAVQIFLFWSEPPLFKKHEMSEEKKDVAKDDSANVLKVILNHYIMFNKHQQGSVCERALF